MGPSTRDDGSEGELGVADGLDEPRATVALIPFTPESDEPRRSRGSFMTGAETSLDEQQGGSRAPRLAMHPDREGFDALAREWALVPVWAELLADVSTPVGLFPAVAGEGPGILLESVERSERWGRYSFVGGDPAATLILDESGLAIQDAVRDLPLEIGNRGSAREELIAAARSIRGPRLPDLPPLTGGLMGYLAYEAAGLLDGHPAPHPEEAPCPPIGLLAIDRAVVFDHWRQRLILVAHVPAGGYDGGVAALEDLAARIASAATPALATMNGTGTTGVGDSNMADDDYRGIVSSFKEHILAGDIYQGVPSRRVSFDAPEGGFPIYRRLRVSNPAPYMFFLRMLGMELAGSSPNRSCAWRDVGCPPGRSPAPDRGDARRSATACSNTSCSPTRRNRRSTRCSSTSHATTWVACAFPAPFAPRS